MRLSEAFLQPKNLPIGKMMINNSQQGKAGTYTQPAKAANRTGSINCTVFNNTTHGALDG
ncbi:MAG: hypothetical protein ACJ8LG_04265 [Massilia sp.]